MEQEGVAGEGPGRTAWGGRGFAESEASVSREGAPSEVLMSENGMRRRQAGLAHRQLKLKRAAEGQAREPHP